MRPVQQLMHLAMRWTSDDQERIRAELLRQRREYYEAELTDQAARVGCPGRRGRLAEGPILSQLNDASLTDAISIVNTYNYDLARAILSIYSEVRTANRWVYASRLQAWEAARAGWKDPQIAQYAEVSARSLAQQHFHQYNATLGYAVLEPGTAVCPVCQGWIERGEVSLHEAQNNPPPYHINCPHIFACYPDRVAKSECADLWVGG